MVEFLRSEFEPAVQAGVSERVGLIVAGVHRSGTSALTRVLNLLGCSIADNLLPANPANELGYWEPTAFVSFNDELLASAGSGWTDWRPLDGDREYFAINAPNVARGRALLRASFGDAPLFVVKDPRMGRLFPFWRKVFALEGMTPRVILSLRNPEEVVRSFHARDCMDMEYARLLWLRDILDAERNTRGFPRTVVHYAHMLRDWRDAVARLEAGLGFALPPRTSDTEMQVDRFLTPALRHHVQSSPENPEVDSIDAWANQAYEILLKWSEAGENLADFSDLDAIDLKLTNVSRSFSKLVRPAMFAGEGGAGFAETEQMELSQGDFALLTSRLAEVQAHLEAESAERHRADSRQAELTAKIAHISSELSQRQEEVEQTRRELAEATAALQAQIECAGSLQSELDRSKEKSASDDAWVFKLAAERREAEAARDKAQRTRASAERRIRQLEASVGREAELFARVGTLQGRLEAAESARIEAEELRRKSERGQSEQVRRAVQRDRELATLANLLYHTEDQAVRESENVEWLRRLQLDLMKQPRWWSWMPSRLRERWQLARLARKGIFDAMAYCEIYPDVAQAGVNPLRHYLLHGMVENRIRPQG